MEKIPIFILAGIDKNDEFGRKRLYELKKNNKFLLEYLIEEIKKSECFSDVYLISDQKFNNVFPNVFFIKAKKAMWQNIQLVYSTFNKKYLEKNQQIGAIVSDILPKAEDFKDIFSSSHLFFNNDILLTVIPNDKLKKKRGRYFLRKDLTSPSLSYAATGGFYVLRPYHLRENFIYFLASLRMGRGIRKIEIEENKIIFYGLKSIRSLIIFLLKILQILIFLPVFNREIFLFLKMLYKHQKRTLTFESAEEIASQIFIKKKYLKNKKNYCRVQIVDNQSFFEDIDDEKDLKLLDNN